MCNMHITTTKLINLSTLLRNDNGYEREKKEKKRGEVNWI